MNPIHVWFLALLPLALCGCRPQPDPSADRPSPPMVTRVRPLVSTNATDAPLSIDLAVLDPLAEITPGPAWFDSVWNYFPSRSTGQIHLSGLNGLLRSDGSVSVAPEYRYIHASAHDLYQMASPFSYAQPLPFAEAARWGIMTITGIEILSPIYSRWPRPLGEGLFAVVENGRLKILNQEGKVAFPALFDEVEEFSSGFAAVKGGGPRRSINDGGQGGKWGFIDPRGKLVLPMKYDWARPFKKGLAWVHLDCKKVTRVDETACEGGRWELIDQSGKHQLQMKIEEIEWLERPRHEYAWKNSNERHMEDVLAKVTVRALVKENPEAVTNGVIDEGGMTVIPLARYQSIQRAWDYLIVNTVTNEWILFDFQGKQLNKFDSEKEAVDWAKAQMGREEGHPDSQIDCRNPFQWEPACIRDYPEKIVSPEGGLCVGFVHRQNGVLCLGQDGKHRLLKGVTRVLDFNGPWAPFEKAGRWGFLDSSARVAYPAELDYQFVSREQCDFRLDRDSGANSMFFSGIGVGKPRWMRSVIACPGLRTPMRSPNQRVLIRGIFPRMKLQSG